MHFVLARGVCVERYLEKWSKTEFTGVSEVIVSRMKNYILGIFLSLLCLVTTELWKQLQSTTVTDIDVSYCIMYVLSCVLVLT